MANQLYHVTASPDNNTIDAVVAQSPVIVGENRARLDPIFCDAIADAYKKDFYIPQIRQQIKQYGQAYTYPTINVCPENSNEVTLEDNLNRLWRDWAYNKIETIEAAKEKEIASSSRNKRRSILVGIAVFINYSIKVFPQFGFTPFTVIGGVVPFGTVSAFTYYLLKFSERKNREVKDLQMYKSLSGVRMRTLT